MIMKLKSTTYNVQRCAIAIVCSFVLALAMTPIALADEVAAASSTPVTAEDILQTEEANSLDTSLNYAEEDDKNTSLIENEIEDIGLLGANIFEAKKNTYKVKYVALDAEKGKTFTKTYVLNKSMKLAAPKWRRTGYTLQGWSTTKYSIHKYNLGTRKSKGIGKKAGETITLYADWWPNIYKIYYKLNGGKNGPETGYYYTGDKIILSEIEPTRKGYRFLGWSEQRVADDGSSLWAGSYVDYDTPRNMTFYAQWIRSSRA